MKWSVHVSALTIFIVSTLAISPDTSKAYPTCAVKKPLPSGCGLRGYLTYNLQEDFPLADPAQVNSAAECAVICAARSVRQDEEHGPYYGTFGYPFCRGFSYDSGSKLCQMGHFAPTTKDVKKSATSNKTFYDIKCFNCGDPCPQPMSTQLLYDGDFQKTYLGPWDSLHAELGKGYQSSRAYTCVAADPRECYLRQPLNICKDQTYLFQFDYLSVYTNQSDTVPAFYAGFGGYDWEQYAGQNTYFYYNGISNNTDVNGWQTVRSYFQHFGDPYLGPFFNFSGGGAFSIDNVVAMRIPEPKVNSSSPSLIKNGGFESGKLEPWKTTETNFTIVSPGIHSDYALQWKVQVPPYHYELDPVVQTVQTKPGTSYLLSFDGITTCHHAGFKVKISTGPENIKKTNGVNGMDSFSFSVPLYATDANTPLQFQVQVVPTKGTCKGGIASITLDNFKMVEITNY